MRVAVILTILITLPCCSSEYEGVVEGYWTIRQLEYQEKNYLGSIYGNTVLLKADGKCELPRMSSNSSVVPQRLTGKWKLIQEEPDSLFLCLSVNNEIFNQCFKVEFYLDETEKLLFMDISSNNTFIRATKLLSDYKKYEDLLKSIIKSDSVNL